jgi:hypothetical protein
MANRFSSGKWAGFLNLGGEAADKPDCISLNSGGQVTCFAEAYNSGIYVDLFNGHAWTVSDWSGYSSLGGQTVNNASCTSQIADELVCGAIGAQDNAFYANVDSGIWSGWIKIGGTGIGTPSCAPLGTGQVVCVVMGINNKLTSVVGP